MIPVGPVGEVGDPPLRPLALSRARFASDYEREQCHEHANGGNGKPPTSATTPTTPDRWPIVVALLVDRIGATRKLVRRLERWRPAAARKHWIVDDCRRRQWQREARA